MNVNYVYIITKRVKMPEYRAYIIGDDGHFFEAVPLECAVAALDSARPIPLNRAGFFARIFNCG